MQRTQFAPGDPRLYDLDPDFLPVLVAHVDEDGRWVVTCPYCRRRNTHSAEVGFRHSHCHCDGMRAPGRMDGYVIAPPGALHAPYGDVCHRCPHQLDVYSPIDLEANGRSVTGAYVCRQSHTWICTWADDPDGRRLRPSGTSKRCALYYHYDEAGTLLYVGITDNLAQRGRDHARESAWVKFAKRVEAEWLDSRIEAERAERLAIRQYKPVFNITHALGDPEERIARYLRQRSA